MAALILPEPPAAYDFFGLNLVGYLAQPGSAFVVNRYGFDVGHRKFLVNTDVADLGAFVMGSPDFKYPKMYVHKVTNEVIGGPWTIVDVEYLGQIYPNKPHEVSTDADIRKTSLLFFYGLSSVNWQVEVSEVTVQDVYVTDILPDLNLAGSVASVVGGGTGSVLTPPITLPPPSVESLNKALGLPTGTIHIFTWWWELRRRSLRIAGAIDGSLPVTIRSFLSGSITLSNGSNALIGTNTRFLSQLIPGSKIYAVSPPYTYNSSPDANQVLNQIALEFANGFTVSTIADDTHATLTVPFTTYLLGMNFTGSFYTNTTTSSQNFPGLSGITAGSGSSTALYEVTDSWKRVVLLFGEPIANALSQ